MPLTTSNIAVIIGVVITIVLIITIVIVVVLRLRSTSNFSDNSVSSADGTSVSNGDIVKLYSVGSKEYISPCGEIDPVNGPYYVSSQNNDSFTKKNGEVNGLRRWKITKRDSTGLRYGDTIVITSLYNNKSYKLGLYASTGTSVILGVGSMPIDTSENWIIISDSGSQSKDPVKYGDTFLLYNEATKGYGVLQNCSKQSCNGISGKDCGPLTYVDSSAAINDSLTRMDYLWKFEKAV